MVRLFKAMTRVLAVVTITGATMVGTASAQTANGFPGQGGVYNTLGVSDVTAMLGELEIATEVRPSSTPGRSPAIVATLNSGARFIVGMFQCDDATAGNGCKQALVTTVQPAAGISFDDINSFNGVSNVTTLVYDGQNQILLFGRNVYALGGIGRDNFKFSVFLFLKDMQTFVETRRPGAASVSFNVTPDLNVNAVESKIAPISVSTDDPLVQRMLVSSDASLEVEVAINNSVDKSFEIDGDLFE